MRYHEFIIDSSPDTFRKEYDRGWNWLNRLKQSAKLNGDKMAGSYQLFVPRSIKQVDEAAPILKPGRAITPPGRNKPQADLWTSTATKVSTGWTSDWALWTHENMSGWFSNKGYLYRIKPGALILSFNSDAEAKKIFRIFQDLGRVKDPIGSIDIKFDNEMIMHSTFPWDQVTRHFDAVTHNTPNRQGFMYGWDVESTAWLDTSFLQLVSEVPVVVVDGN